MKGKYDIKIVVETSSRVQGSQEENTFSIRTKGVISPEAPPSVT